MHNKVKKNIHKSFSSSNVIESVDVNNSVVNVHCVRFRLIHTGLFHSFEARACCKALARSKRLVHFDPNPDTK